MFKILFKKVNNNASLLMKLSARFSSDYLRVGMIALSRTPRNI